MWVLLERPGQISCGGLDNRRRVRLAVSSNEVTNQKSNLSHINFFVTTFIAGVGFHGDIYLKHIHAITLFYSTR